MDLKQKTIEQLKAMESIVSIIFYNDYSKDDIWQLLGAIINEMDGRILDEDLI